jgi:hypothetical protein
MPTTKASKPWPKLLGFNLARWVDAEEENVRQFTAPVEGMPTYTISLSIILFVIVDDVELWSGTMRRKFEI